MQFTILFNKALFDFEIFRRTIICGPTISASFNNHKFHFSVPSNLIQSTPPNRAVWPFMSWHEININFIWEKFDASISVYLFKNDCSNLETVVKPNKAEKHWPNVANHIKPSVEILFESYRLNEALYDHSELSYNNTGSRHRY